MAPEDPKPRKPSSSPSPPLMPRTIYCKRWCHPRARGPDAALTHRSPPIMTRTPGLLRSVLREESRSSTSAWILQGPRLIRQWALTTSMPFPSALCIVVLQVNPTWISPIALTTHPVAHVTLYASRDTRARRALHVVPLAAGRILEAAPQWTAAAQASSTLISPPVLSITSAGPAM